MADARAIIHVSQLNTIDLQLTPASNYGNELIYFAGVAKPRSDKQIAEIKRPKECPQAFSSDRWWNAISRQQS
jgi:hypothetical protein